MKSKLKRLFVGYTTALTIFSLHKRDKIVLPVLPITEQIPEGAEVVSVHNEWERDGFTFTIYHDSFPEVPLGEIPPTIMETVQMKEYQIEGNWLTEIVDVVSKKTIPNNI